MQEMEPTVGPGGCRIAVQAGKGEPVKRSIVCCGVLVSVRFQLCWLAVSR